MNGTVLFYNKTYGFIKSKGINKDIYFTHKDIIPDEEGMMVISSGDFVEFELLEGKESRATQVKQSMETSDGLPVIKVKIFKMDKSSFTIEEFYKEVVSRSCSGIKRCTVLGDHIIATSASVPLDIIIDIFHKKKAKGIVKSEKFVYKYL